MGWLDKALGDPLGKESQKAANQANIARHGKAMRWTEEFEDRLPGMFRYAERPYDDAMSALDEAMVNLGYMGEASRLAAKDQGRRALGRGTAGLGARGLGGSSLYGNLSRAVASDTARSVRSVNEGVAGMESNLYGAMANLQQNRAGHRIGSVQAQSDWRRFKVGTLLQRQDVGTGGWLGPVAQAVGNIAAGFTGGSTSTPGQQQGGTTQDEIPEYLRRPS